MLRCGKRIGNRPEHCREVLADNVFSVEEKRGEEKRLQMGDRTAEFGQLK
jgi:hypothetical protein